MDKKQKIISITLMVLGGIMLVVGVVFLVLKLTAGPKVADGDYLVSTGEWVLENEPTCVKESSNEETTAECAPKVVWNFTEIGKGTLTTNNHTNDYDFKWAIEDDKLIVETDWLYELNNEFEYQLDQETGRLTLTANQQEYTFTSKQ